MKSLVAMALLATLAVSATPQSADGAAGTPGVMDDTCWKNSSSNEINVEVRGTIHGDQEITVNEGETSGTGTGTPDPDGGCAESSAVFVGGEAYRVKSGGMEWRNPDDDWIDMTEVKCDEDDDGGTPPLLLGDGTIGSVPSKVNE